MLLNKKLIRFNLNCELPLFVTVINVSTYANGSQMRLWNAGSKGGKHLQNLLNFLANKQFNSRLGRHARVRPSGLHNRKITTFVATALSCFVIGTSTADDTEIFFNSETNPPNVLFIVDVSGSMNWTDNPSFPDIPGNVLWLDGSDRSTLLDAQGDRANNYWRFSGQVSTWLDKSGNGNHLRGSSATLGEINRRSTVRFTNDIMTGPDLFDGVMTEATIFFVQQENASSSNFFLNFNGDSTGDGRLSFHTPWRGNRNWYWDAGSWRTGNRSYIRRPTEVGDVTQVTAYKTLIGNENGISLNNGTFSTVDAGATAAPSSGGMHFGRGVSDHELAEMIVYDRKLSDTEIETVQAYLDLKWRTRLERLKVSLNTLLNSNDGFNAGLMTYSSYARGQFSLRNEIKPVADSKNSLLTHINSLYASGGTPTSSALFEGMLHYRGEPPREMGGITASGQPPMVQCQSNHIVLLTDGEPYGGPAWPSIGRYIGSDCATDRGKNTRGGNCGIELAEYMKNNDHYSTVRGENNIITHTIGLSLDIPWLDDIAKAGGGGYYTAGTSDQLVSAFESIVDVAIDHATTFVSPSVTIDQFTRLEHRDDTYLALFQPNSTVRWPGNLKRYDFSGDPPAIRDQNGEKVLDSSTGTFSDDAHSFWSDEADGADTVAGGAVSMLDAESRTVTTYTGKGTKYLSDKRNEVHEDNASDLDKWINLSGDSLKKLLAWARGVDVDDEDRDGSVTDTRHHMGDPLHSIPVIVNYGGTSAELDSVVFIGTNEGFLHAINAKDGEEVFSFIPTELLGNLPVFYENESGVTRPYGMDGDLTLWLNDENNDGSVDSLSEHAYLYAGMRRGGRSYYALDVSEKENPKYLWSIEGGSNDRDFAELGQTWSKPTKSKVKIGKDVKDVLIFGGGYDPAQDYATTRTADTMGNTVFIVDAKDGSLIWKADSSKSDYSKMVYSIPSDPQLVDLDGDSLVDQMYIGDMGGQMWRFDFNSNAASAAELVTGGVIADLASDDKIDNRRFFYPPEVALIARNGTTLLSLAFGSGNRTHPLGRGVHNRFYMITQDSVKTAPEGYGIYDKTTSTLLKSYRPITEKDLYDASKNEIESSDGEIALAAKSALDEAHGWMIKLDRNGEKVLGGAATIDHNIVFATYLPDNSGQSTDACQPATGGNRGYVVSLYDATPITDTEFDADPSERYEEINQPGIAGTASVIIDRTKDKQSVNVVLGLDAVEIPQVDFVDRVYWSEYPEF